MARICIRQSLQRPMATCTHLLWGGTPPFPTRRRLPAHVQTGTSSLTSEWAYLFALAELNLPLGLLMSARWEQKLSFTLLDTRQCPAQRPTVSYFQHRVLTGVPRGDIRGGFTLTPFLKLSGELGNSPVSKQNDQPGSSYT